MPQIRGVFPLPQTSPQIAGVDQVVCLPSGGIYVLPPGNFIVTTGPSTYLEYFDPLQTIWRPTQPHQAFGYLSCDGSNYRLLNGSGIVSSVTITAAGSGGTNGIGPVETGTTISFAASPSGAQAVGYVIVGGSVPAPQLVQGGSEFVVAPLVCCDPPPVGGIQATFTATISAAGVITAVTLVNPGAGYTSIPQFYIIPQPMFCQSVLRWPRDFPPQKWPAPGLINQANVWPGTIYQPNIPVNPSQGALIVGQPLTGSGTVTGINIIYNGAGYTGTATPAITFAGGPLTGAVATSQMSLSAPAVGQPVALGGTSTVGEVVTIPGTIPAVLTAVDTAGNFIVTSPGMGIQPGAIASNGQPVPAAALGGTSDTSYVQAKVN